MTPPPSQVLSPRAGGLLTLVLILLLVLESCL